MPAAGVLNRFRRFNFVTSENLIGTVDGLKMFAYSPFQTQERRVQPSQTRDVTLRFRLEGTPTAWKRPAQIRGTNARYDAQSEMKAAQSLLLWKQFNEQLPGAVRGRDLPVFRSEVAVAVHLILNFRKPPNPAVWYPNKMDVDNCAKYALDLLQSSWLKGAIWNDDKQVCKLLAEKRYSMHECTEIIIKGIYE